jgi:hypothetical protein
MATYYLTRESFAADTISVPEKEGTGFGDLNNESARTAQSGFFTCVLAFVRSQWAAVAWDTFGYAGVLSCRFANPTICRPPRLATGRG